MALNILETLNVGGILTPTEEETKDKVVADTAAAANGEKSVDFKAGIVGEIRQGIWSAAPAGWLLCDGALYDYETNPDYKPLWEVMSAEGFPFNTGGETATQFRVPDMDGKIAYGAGAAAVGDAVGANTKDLQHVHSHSHSHGMAHDHDTTPHTHPFTIASHNHGGSTGGTAAEEENNVTDEGGTETLVTLADHDHNISGETLSGDTDEDTGDNTSGAMEVGTANTKNNTDAPSADNTDNPTVSMANTDVRQASYAFTFIIKW